MMAFTHVAIGALIGTVSGRVIEAQTALQSIMLAGAIVGSLLPDIDHPQSWLGRRVAIVSIPLSMLIGHRGLTHSFLALFVALVGCWMFAGFIGLSGGVPIVFAAMVCAGYISHLLADWFTPAGVPWLWPRARRFCSPITIQVGGGVEYLLGATMWLLVIMLV